MNAAATLRDELERLRAAGLLREVSRAVDPRFEVTAVADAAGPGTGLLFGDVAGRRVAIGTLGSRDQIAASFGVSRQEVTAAFLDAMQNPLAPVEVDDAPVHEVVLRDDEIDLRRDLPVLTHHERDGGPYITTGVAVAESRDRSRRNLSYHRIQVRSARETGMVIVQRHLHRLVEEFDAHDEPAPVAIAIGLDGATRLAAASSGSLVPFGFDELGIAGALHGAPVRMVPGVSIPVLVPADAEIVIEGHVLPGELQPEGPFAEFDGSYESEPARVFRASALTMRSDAVYQGLTSGSVEQLNIMGLPNEAVLLGAIRAVVPGARAVRVSLGGLRKFHAVVSVDKRIEGDGFDAMVAAFAGHRDLKQVIIVDGDVDPFDDLAVERAVATWFQADRDLLVVGGGRGNPVDRSLRADGQTARMGLDATRPVGRPAEEFERAVIPGAAGLDLSAYL
ncbi:MAG TPA: UbiD family decarboxylase [Pseudolysinimonas sp.]|nr:UbiD family decarboxylase [Pseudolysinimonas sp.]